ncbi:MAG: Carbamoyl-phosphate synthase large chain [Planctomycetes bacterium]|nr:Carbamoyl-phosphate synthase large chain [Planctomycetota bacterium]HRJ77737.1 carbamoyl-phosphate synthase large subunit [Planctomycetota bacterium]
MPKRTDIKSIMIIGSGPIIIGQACEFDYSGTQACKALREEGYRVVLVNSNPATIMTDPEMADRTYVEPVTPEICARIIERERPDALLPTLGGQTALNTAVSLHNQGVLKKFKVELIGASIDAIHKAEDRELFKRAIQKLGFGLPVSKTAKTWDECRAAREFVGLPAVIRPSFTMGGTGGGIAFNAEEFEEICRKGLSLSPTSEVLIEEYLAGWKEYELEVMRDKKDNFVVICSIENFDPMGVHTGDSITVAPSLTLTDKEYQLMRDEAKAIIREIGVETGGSNIQFAVDPRSGRRIVIEMNPRVSRSSALASKATGFPIAKFAAKLAVGYTLDELRNDITKATPASFEPSIDYIVVKTPRWAFEKFPGADPRLTTQMKSVGEAMSIGRTFKEALQKALRSLEIGRAGLGADSKEAATDTRKIPRQKLKEGLIVPGVERIFNIRRALRMGMTPAEISSFSGIDPWFLDNIQQVLEFEADLRELASRGTSSSRKAQEPAAGGAALLDAEMMRDAKRMGFSDAQLATIFRCKEQDVRQRRKQLGVIPAYKIVDTCAGEFEARTPYYYSTYEEESELRPSDKKKIMVIGGGPNRIGQGIEFDYCCVHASMALRELGYESIMVNSNPETVSTDFDISNHLFFEPLTFEDVMNIYEAMKPVGVIVQFGGQTPINLARRLADAGVPIIGTSVDAIEEASDRERFGALCQRLGIRQPRGATSTTRQGVMEAARKVGYPVLVRPSFVLGGRAMEICYDEAELEQFVGPALEVAEGRPVLLDQFLDDAIEVDVDAVSDGEQVTIAGIMEQIEYAGVHSGDSMCSIPTHSLPENVLRELRETTIKLARALKVCGLMNVQYAIKDGQVYVIEVNPRASRTAPFVAKAIGVPIAKIATKCMCGQKLKDLGFTQEILPRHHSIKKPVFPFNKFPGADALLAPEMRSTGEVMGIDVSFGRAMAKAQAGASQKLPLSGKVFISVKTKDKARVPAIAQKFQELGFAIVATGGTAKAIEGAGVPVQRVNKIQEGRPNVLDMIINGEVGLLINTPSGKDPRTDEAAMRRRAIMKGIPILTTLSAAEAAVRAIASIKGSEETVKCLQEFGA